MSVSTKGTLAARLTPPVVRLNDYVVHTLALLNLKSQVEWLYVCSTVGL